MPRFGISTVNPSSSLGSQPCLLAEICFRAAELSPCKDCRVGSEASSSSASGWKSAGNGTAGYSVNPSVWASGVVSGLGRPGVSGWFSVEDKQLFQFIVKCRLVHAGFRAYIQQLQINLVGFQCIGHLPVSKRRVYMADSSSAFFNRSSSRACWRCSMMMSKHTSFACNNICWRKAVACASSAFVLSRFIFPRVA